MMRLMEMIHFVHSVGTARSPTPTTEQPAPQSVSVWDARTYTPRQLVEQIPQLLREFQFAEVSHLDPMPWLRAILLVSPQLSDALALSVMSEGVMVLEAPRERSAVEVIEQFLHQAGQFQTTTTRRSHEPPHNPSSPSNPARTGNESEFSREPACFNQALYSEWLGKLSQPWRSEDAFESES